ncbi:MAG: hypothetical protein ACLPZF_22985, partial [Candidatus Acidiferrales bacterium]
PPTRICRCLICPWIASVLYRDPAKKSLSAQDQSFPRGRSRNVRQRRPRFVGVAAENALPLVYDCPSFRNDEFNSARTRGCQLEVVNANQQIRDLFSMTNLLSLFEPAGRHHGKTI